MEPMEITVKTSTGERKITIGDGILRLYYAGTMQNRKSLPMVITVLKDMKYDTFYDAYQDLLGRKIGQSVTYWLNDGFSRVADAVLSERSDYWGGTDWKWQNLTNSQRFYAMVNALKMVGYRHPLGE